MKRFFGMDTKLYRFCAFLWNMIYLNILTLLGCIPVITVGASLTAMHYVMLKMVRGEEGYIGRMYWNAFKKNFKQATILWAAVLALFISYRVDWVVVTANADMFGKPIQYGILILAILTFLGFQFLYPLLSHFENTLLMTVQNAMILCVSKFPRAVAMAAVWIIPYIIFRYSPVLFPLVLMLGFSFPGFVCAKMYHTVFKMLEPQEEESE